jgi:hypothetical protein
MNWFKKYLIAFASDTWTYVGLLIAFFTLDGSAKVVTGYLILIGLVIWLISFPWREDS